MKQLLIDLKSRMTFKRWVRFIVCVVITPVMLPVTVVFYFLDWLNGYSLDITKSDFTWYLKWLRFKG